MPSGTGTCCCDEGIITPCCSIIPATLTCEFTYNGNTYTTNLNYCGLGKCAWNFGTNCLSDSATYHADSSLDPNVDDGVFSWVWTGVGGSRITRPSGTCYSQGGPFGIDVYEVDAHFVEFSCCMTRCGGAINRAMSVIQILEYATDEGPPALALSNLAKCPYGTEGCITPHPWHIGNPTICYHIALKYDHIGTGPFCAGLANACNATCDPFSLDWYNDNVAIA